MEQGEEEIEERGGWYKNGSNSSSITTLGLYI